MFKFYLSKPRTSTFSKANTYKNTLLTAYINLSLLSALSVASINPAWACRCKYNIDYVATTSVEDMNNEHQNQIVATPNSAYFRLVNSNNEVLQDNLYDVEPYENDYIVAKRNGHYGVIDTSGAIVLNFTYDEIKVLENGLFLLTVFMGNQKSMALVSDNGEWVYPTNTKFKKGVEISSIYFDEETKKSYFKVLDNGKYGAIDSTGKLVVPLIYDKFEYPDRYDYYQGMIEVRLGNKTGLIDLNHVILVPLAENQSIEPFSFQNDLVKVTTHKAISKSFPEDTYTDIAEEKVFSEYVVNTKGDILVKTDKPFKHFDSDLKLYNQANNYGLINNRAEILLKAEFEAIETDTSTSVIVSKGNKFALATKTDDGVWRVQDYYDNIEAAYIGEQLREKIKTELDEDERSEIKAYIVENNNAYGVIDRLNKQLVPIIYDDVEVQGVLFRVKQNGKYGLLNHNNQFVIDVEYDDIQPIKVTGNYDHVDGYLLSRNNQQSIVDNKGKVLIPPSNIRIVDELDGFYIKGVLIKEGKYGIYDFENKQYILEPKYEKLIKAFSNDLILVQLEGRKQLLNKDGSVINSNLTQYVDLEEGYEESNLSVKTVENKYGIMSYSGEIIVPAEYDYIEGNKLSNNYLSLINGGEEAEIFYTVTTDGLVGVLDNTGQVTIPPEYTYIESLEFPAYFAVSKSDDETDNKVGLVNTKGEKVLEEKYNRVTSNREPINTKIYALNTIKNTVDIYDAKLNLIDAQDLEDFRLDHEEYF